MELTDKLVCFENKKCYLYIVIWNLKRIMMFDSSINYANNQKQMA